MSGYKSFAVAGAGTIGQPIIEELANLKRQGLVSSVVVLTRSTGQTEALYTGKTQREEEYFVGLGAGIAKVEYENDDSLAEALKGVDVVISTLSQLAFSAQEKLAYASKASGVKLFVPSEFGFPTKGRTEGVFGEKDRLRQLLEGWGLPFSCFYVGLFPETTFIPFMEMDLSSGKATVAGNGNAEISFTSTRDIARFVAHVLTALPASKLENSFFAIEGERTSINRVIQQYQDRTGKTIEIEHVPIESVEAALQANPADLLSGLRLRWSGSDATVGEVANDEYPEWNPKKVIDVLVE